MGRTPEASITTFLDHRDMTQTDAIDTARFAELKKKHSVIWGNGPYEQMPAHYEPLLAHLAKAADARPGGRVLDVATGTGALALRLARTGASVTGVDLAPALVDIAQRLAEDEGLDIRYE